MNIAELKCPACGAPVKRKTERGYVFCEYCGTKIILDDIDYYKEDAKTDRLQNVTGTMERLVGTYAEREESLEKTREYVRKMVPKMAAVMILLLILMVVLIKIA